MKTQRILAFIGFTVIGWSVGSSFVPKLSYHSPQTTVDSKPKDHPKISQYWASFRATSMAEFLSLREQIRSSEHMSPGRRLIAESTLIRNLTDAMWEEFVQSEQAVEVPYLELGAYLSKRAQSDPAGTMALLERWRAAGRELRHVGTYEQYTYCAWVKQDPEAAIAHVLNKTQSGIDRWALHYFIESWAWDDPKQALLTYARLAPDKDIGHDAPGTTLRSSFGRWLDRDKAAATQWANHEAPERFREALQKTMNEKLPIDAQWDIALADPRQTSRVCELYAGMLQKDPTAAAQKLNDPNTLKSLANGGSLAMSLEWGMIYDNNVESNLLKMTAALHKYPDFADDLLSGFAGYRQRTDFPLAAKIATHIKDEAKRKACYLNLTKLNLATSPERVSEWLKQLPPEDPARHEAVAWMVTDLSSSDPAAAKAWADTIPAVNSQRKNAEEGLLK